MTLIEDMTLAGYFQIEGIPFEPDVCIWGESENIIDVDFYSRKEGFYKLKEKNLEVDEKLSLLENLEKLKKNNAIRYYEATSLIKKGDRVEIIESPLTCNGRYKIKTQKNDFVEVDSEILKELVAEQMINYKY